ncbi:MAG TPA: APC family permease, partial [Pseudonocardia sp.]|nr:APC family permease [Pseudonocardia sp.]
AGWWLPLAVLLAGLIALANAVSTADLAAAYPESGGGYVYGRERLGPAAGRLAGVAFLVGKSSSAAAAAGVFAAYVLPAQPLPTAIAAVLAATALNIAGVRWTARAAYALVGGTLAVLLVVVAVGLFGSGGAEVASAATPGSGAVAVRGGLLGVGTAAGLVFFAFAGYARIATLGEEVRNPARTLPRAILIALGVALATYLLVAIALLVGLGPDRLAVEVAPLVALVDTGRASAVGVLVRVGAAAAAGSALLTVLIAISRMTLAMARRGELPTVLAVISPRGTPCRADLVGGLVAIVIAVLAGPAAAIAVSACSVLIYYAVINLAALRLPTSLRHWPNWSAGVGLVGCLALAVLLPFSQVMITAGVLAILWTACTVLPQRSG